jgi:uncharacterized membrane protein YesL
MAKDLEDRFAETIEWLWLETLAHGWNVADRIFKITGWALLIGAIEALHQKSQIEELRYIVISLIVLMFIAAVASVMNAMIHYQEKAFNRLPGSISEGWRILIMLGVNTFLIIAGTMITLPALIAAVGIILKALSNV